MKLENLRNERSFVAEEVPGENVVEQTKHAFSGFFALDGRSKEWLFLERESF